MICILQKRAAASTTTSTSSVSTKYLPPTLKEIAIEEREKWIQQNEHLEQDPLTRGPHYLRGHRHPFPLNPLYKPIAPLSHSTRLAITEAYSQGTALPEIGMKYGISLLRVHGMCHPPFIIKIIKAIIKLGIIAKDWTSKGIPLQFNLQENMERLLGAQDRTNSSEKLVPMEKLKPLPSQREAADILKVAPFASINGLTKVVKDSKFVEIESVKDAKELSKHTFLFTDPSNKDMFVRENNGILRGGTRQDMYWRDNRKPKYRATRN